MGMSEAKKQPAMIAWLKAPWQRTRPLRTSVCSGTPPKTEKTLRCVTRSKANAAARSPAVAAMYGARPAMSSHERIVARKKK